MDAGAFQHGHHVEGEPAVPLNLLEDGQALPYQRLGFGELPALDQAQTQFNQGISV